MPEMPRASRLPTLLMAVALGLVTTLVDFFAANGDVSPPVTLAVLLAAGILLGRFVPTGQWLAALLLGLILPVVHVLAHAVGYDDHVSPNTYGARLLMVPVTVGVALVGTWIGTLLRTARRRSARA